MADNAEGAIPFQGVPPASGPNAFFPFQPGGDSDSDAGSKLDVGADSGVNAPNVPSGPLDGRMDVNFGAIRGVPCPDDRLSDSLNGPDDVVILGG